MSDFGFGDVDDRVVPGVAKDQSEFDREKNAGPSPRAPRMETWLAQAMAGQVEAPEDVVLAARVVAQMDASYADPQALARVDAEVRREETRKGDPLPAAQRERLVDEDADRVSEIQALLRQCADPDGDDDDREGEGPRGEYSIEGPEGPEGLEGEEPQSEDPKEADLRDEGPDGPEPLPDFGPDPESVPALATVPQEPPREGDANLAADDSGLVPPVEDPPPTPPALPRPTEAEEAGVLDRLPIIARRRTHAAPAPGAPPRLLTVARKALAAAPASSDARVFEEIGKLEAQIQDMTQVLSELKASVQLSNANNRAIKTMLQAGAVKESILPEVDPDVLDGSDPVEEWERPVGNPGRPAATGLSPALRYGALAAVAILGTISILGLAVMATGRDPGPGGGAVDVAKGDRVNAAKAAANARAAYLRGERTELQTVLRVEAEGAHWVEVRRKAMASALARPGATDAERTKTTEAAQEAEQDLARWGREALRAKANLLRIQAKLPE